MSQFGLWVLEARFPAEVLLWGDPLYWISDQYRYFIVAGGDVTASLTCRVMPFSSLFDFGTGCIIAVMCPLDGTYPPSLSHPWFGCSWSWGAPLFPYWLVGVLFLFPLYPCLFALACLLIIASWSFKNVVQSFIACLDTCFPSTNMECMWHGDTSILHHYFVS
jgi:hypothetical protein